MPCSSINRRDVVLATAGMVVVAATASSTSAQTIAGPGMPNEPHGGQPPAGSTPSVKDFDYQIKYQRAFEAMLWSIPATSIYAFRRAFDSVGLKDNDIGYLMPPRLVTPSVNVKTRR